MELLLQAIIQGMVQGLTEILPISSSAHLILLPRLMGWDDPFLSSAEFDVMLHLGTLAALLAYFWRDLIRLAVAWVASIRERRLGADPDRRLAWLLLLTVIPAALVGALFEDFFDETFRDALLVIPLLLVVGAGMLAFGERFGRRERGLEQLGVKDALVIGLAQALALFPGMSRSGVTIAAGLVLGLEREAAARFAFLMGIPVIAGAGLWKLRVIIAGETSPFEPVVLAAGMAASALAGLAAIVFLLRYLRTRSTGIFIVYRLIFAAVAAVLILTR
ncbi:MAG: undecaprenyl-diphosphatase UppP [Chloroflexota bacterium]|nr:undecaprenyl-diphosphatase UppP [Chloroflexota bacterium]